MYCIHMSSIKAYKRPAVCSLTNSHVLNAASSAYTDSQQTLACMKIYQHLQAQIQRKGTQRHLKWKHCQVFYHTHTPSLHTRSEYFLFYQCSPSFFRRAWPSVHPVGSLWGLLAADRRHPDLTPLCSSLQTSGRPPGRSSSLFRAPPARCRSGWPDRWRQKWWSCRGPGLAGERRRGNVISGSSTWNVNMSGRQTEQTRWGQSETLLFIDVSQASSSLDYTFRFKHVRGSKHEMKLMFISKITSFSENSYT